MKKFFVFLFIFVLTLVYIILSKNNKVVTVATSFDNCIELGFPLVESMPMQCVDGAGNLFIDNSVFDSNKSDFIRVFNIKDGDIISSPLSVSGEARGSWFFEADFPIKLITDTGIDIPVTPPYVTASGEWMTEDFVPFSGSFVFDLPDNAVSGQLVFVKDNPSGLPENHDEFRINVRFK